MSLTHVDLHSEITNFLNENTLHLDAKNNQELDENNKSLKESKQTQNNKCENTGQNLLAVNILLNLRSYTVLYLPLFE